MKELEVPEALKKLIIENSYEYIRYKATRYLTVGPVKYRRGDALGMPEESLSATEMALIEEGCRQVTEYKGLTKDNPFELLGVEGFYELMILFHFTLDNRVTTRGGPDIFLDKMHMVHMVTGKKMILYNLVKY